MTAKPKHIAEYVLLRVVLGTIGLLPRRIGIVLIWPIAKLSYWIVHKRVKEARRRMREVLGDKPSEKDLRRWSWESWRNLVFNIAELAHAPHMRKSSLLKLYRGIELPFSHARTAKKLGFTVAVCHMGNWELSGIAATTAGLPIFVMMRRQSNPLVTAYLDKRRDHFGVSAIERHTRALGSIIKRIRAGEVFTILPDLRSPNRDSAIVTPYLGGKAYLNAGMALFARHTNTPIVPVIVRRRGWFSHIMEEQPPVVPDETLEKEEDIRRMTAEVMKVFDRAVRETPGQYFWYNKRWVLDQNYASGC